VQFTKSIAVLVIFPYITLFWKYGATNTPYQSVMLSVRVFNTCHKSAAVCTELRRTGYHTIGQICTITTPATVITLVACTASTGLVYKVALIMYRVITMSTPAYLDNLLTIRTSAGPARHSSIRPPLTVTYTSSAFAWWCFSFLLPTVRNSLPSDVQQLSREDKRDICMTLLLMNNLDHDVA